MSICNALLTKGTMCRSQIVFPDVLVSLGPGEERLAADEADGEQAEVRVPTLVGLDSAHRVEPATAPRPLARIRL